ncbi:MAG: YkgJ family cysteine cluster protein [Desulfatirhabdiaceae bacterium]
MEEELIPLSLRDRFTFTCTPSVPCFTECCRDLNQFLTPYDILRLKIHLNLSSREFLDQYTSRHIGPETGLPVVTFKTRAIERFVCPFVTYSGCSVYENRPSSCRTYPLVRMASRSRETGKITAYYALMKEPHCRGFDQGVSRTVQEWVDDQGLLIYNEINDMMMEIIGLKNQLKPGRLDSEFNERMYVALYDLDSFRSFLEGKADSPAPSVLSDDISLLKYAMRWIVRQLISLSPPTAPLTHEP